MDRPSCDASLVNRWFGTFRYETNEAQFLVLEYILAHPTNLPSVKELSEMIPKYTTDEVIDGLEGLIEEGAVERYEPSADEVTRDGPSTFYGLTEEGVEALDNQGFLKITSVAHKLYRGLEKSDMVEAYEDVPRPELEPAVEKHITRYCPQRAG